MIDQLEKQYQELHDQLLADRGRPGNTPKTNMIIYEMKEVYRKLKKERQKFESKFYLNEPA